MTTAALIVAAGRGLRAGGGQPKQRRMLAGRPLAEHTIAAFEAAPGIARIALVLHPDDMAELGVADEDLLEIASPRAKLIGVAKGAPDLRRGVISMAHSWGAASLTDEKVRDVGAPTNRLVDVNDGFDQITGQAIQSGIPVSVTPVSEDALVG